MPQLYPEDQAKVDRYLQLPQHQVVRKPFRPLRLLLVLLLILLALTGVAWVIAAGHGVL